MERRGLEIQLRDASGNVGLGEASPLPGYSPDTLEQARDALSNIPWQSWEPPQDHDGVVVAVNDWIGSLGPLPPSARFAIETAVLDLLGQGFGKPVWALLTHCPSELPQPVPRALLLPTSTLESAVNEGLRALQRGFKTLKVKLGVQSHTEEQILLAALRDELGSDFQLRLDANRSWSVEEAAERLEDLRSFAPEFVEEPFIGGPLSADLKSPVALALDESLQDQRVQDELETILERGSWTTVVLKPMTLGGLLPCLNLAQRAHCTHVGSCVSHVWGNSTAQAATRHLALALPAPLACGVLQGLGTTETENCSAELVSQIRPSRQPGLGVTRPTG